jgi:hypothetical protein
VAESAAGGIGQFARTPFPVAFGSGWFRFSLCTVHVYYGSESGRKLQQRIGEIQRLVKFFAHRHDAEVEAAKKKVTDQGAGRTRTD